MKGKKKASDRPSSVCTWNFILFYFILLYFHISFHDPICLFSSIFFISLIQSNIQYTRIFYYVIAFWRSFSISDNHVWWCGWWRDRICRCNSNVGFLFPLPPLSSLAKTNKGFVEGRQRTYAHGPQPTKDSGASTPAHGYRWVPPPFMRAPHEIIFSLISS